MTGRSSVFQPGDTELVEEVWTCGVDRFTQRVKKFESKAILLQTSALSELSPLSSSRKEVCHVASAHQLFFLLLNPPELHWLVWLIGQERERALARRFCFWDECLYKALEAPPFSVGDSSPPHHALLPVLSLTPTQILSQPEEEILS